MFAVVLKISELWDFIKAVFIGQVFWHAANFYIKRQTSILYDNIMCIPK